MTGVCTHCHRPLHWNASGKLEDDTGGDVCGASLTDPDPNHGHEPQDVEEEVT